MFLFKVFHATSMGSRYWTDLRELTSTTPGTWVWGDGSPLNYHKWQSHQPSTDSELRAYLDKGDTRLYDFDANAGFHFICEK